MERLLKEEYGVVQETKVSTGNVGHVIPGVYYPRRKKNVNCLHPVNLRQKCERAVLKNGELNVDKTNPNRKFAFFSNLFMKMVETRWRWTMLNFFLAFTGEWLFFGFIYWLIAFTHGDLKEEHLPNLNGSEWKPCIKNIYGFTSTFLFSIEVHTTVAYGRRAITLECGQAIIAMCLQCIASSIFQAFMVGILFAKLTRPKSRTNTMLFSKNAVISSRDDKLCLIFRVGDMRKSRILNINAKMNIIKLNTDCEHLDGSNQIPLDVVLDGCESTFFLWPISVIHFIDKTSPLYHVSAADLLSGEVEILAVFEGIIESTGQPVQAKSSYIENEILWGHRFISMVAFDEAKFAYDVDFSKLSETIKIDTPLCSAYEYESVVSEISSNVDSEII